MNVLVLTLSFGSGHVQAARAIAREIETRSPNSNVMVLDALEHCRKFFRVSYVWPYWAMVRYAPVLWDTFFKRRAARTSRHTAPEWAFWFGCPQVFKTITDFKPDSIVATEVAACEMAAMAKRKGLTGARIVSVITDYEAEPAWVKSEVDVYAIPDHEVKAQLAGWGARLANIVTAGIPTSERFRQQYDAKEIRQRHVSDHNVPIVLLMCGGWGPTHMNEVAARLCESGQRMHVIAVTGHDSRMRQRMLGLLAWPPVSLEVIGWTHEIPELMHVATVLVTKPGGVTSAEAALCGLPIVFFDAIPGPERRNAELITRTGAGVFTNDAEETALAVLSLLRDEGARRRMSVRARSLAQPKAAATIAALALNERSAEVIVGRKTA